MKLLSLVIPIIISLFINNIAIAQQSDKIESGRPGLTSSPYVVPAGTLQAEVGLEYEKQSDDNAEYKHPDLLLKYGFFNRFELRLLLDEVTDKERESTQTSTGLQPAEVGIKVLLTKGKNLIPHTSFIADFGMPGLASEKFKARNVFPKLRLIMNNKLNDKLSLTYSGGAIWNGEDTRPEWFYTLNTGYELSDKWEVFAEEYAYMKLHQNAKHTVDGGLSYFISKNVKADLYAGKGISIESSDHFISAGISFRL